MTEIKSFKGNNSFLSNFYLCEVTYEGVIYPSVEHAFQSAKTNDPEEKRKFRVIRDPAEAKRYGRKVELRSDWEEIKDSVMEQCLRSKFSNPILKEKLKSTGSSILIEGNNHGDKYWGSVNGFGSNHLGKLLMKIRSEI